MSLPTPNLDDRKFQDIVDDVKRQIGLRCPEWSDHNVSDPGVTLLELFAYMTETTLFRLNQVPEKNHIRFLEMLGLTLETPEPAQADLRFRISRRITSPEDEMFIPARETRVGTVRTESEDSIDFETDADLRLVAPNLVSVVAVPTTGDLESFAGTKSFPIGKEIPRDDAFSIYSQPPKQNDALYFGFENDVSMNLISLEVDCLSAAASGMNEDYPSQVWEYWNAVPGRWERLDIVSDETRGFNRIGAVEINMPRGLVSRQLGGKSAYWIRTRYTLDPADLPPRGIDQVRPAEYQRSPELVSVRSSTVGGTVSASNSSTVAREILGRSDGLPGQVFKLRYNPLLELRAEETVVVGALGASFEEIDNWTPWTRVDDFANSGQKDRHFTIDYLTGEIAFGPNIVQPDGSGRTYGAIPEKGLTVAVVRYRVGGGVSGNVRENRIRLLKQTIPYVSDVTNPLPATGGRDRETLDRAKLRAKEILQVRNRAVTADDFEFLARQASSSVGRAKCVQPVFHPAPYDSEVRAGVVKVLLVPELHQELLVPRPEDLRIPDRTRIEVQSYLDERRLLTCLVEVSEPRYRFVSVSLKLVADPRADADQVRLRVIEQLNRFIHPTLGGTAGDGWPFRRSLSIADVYAQVGQIRGVAFLLDARLSVSDLIHREDGVLSQEVVVPNTEAIRLEEDQLFCSRLHEVVVVPMSLVGSDAATFGGEA